MQSREIPSPETSVPGKPKGGQWLRDRCEGLRLWLAENSQRLHLLGFLVFISISLCVWASGTSALLAAIDRVGEAAWFKTYKAWVLLGGAALFVVINFLGPYRAIRIWLFLQHDRAVLRNIDRFLSSSLSSRRNCSEWFHMLHLAAGVALAGERRDTITLWVNSGSYMNLHVAAALLSRSYYHSCFKAPDFVWEFLRERGGSRYANQLLSRELKDSFRYVLSENAVIGSAVRDFLLDDYDRPFTSVINGGLQVCVLDRSSPAAAKVHDFSAFAIGKAWIVIRMNGEDEARVLRKFDQLAENMGRNSPQQELEKFKRRLERIRFRAEIQFTGAIADDSRPPEDILRSELHILNHSDARRVDLTEARQSAPKQLGVI